MPRYALLIHESPRGLHYDFFLEHCEVLRTWALSRQPEPSREIPCEALADHRLLYLEYEGSLSAGRGTVTRWDQGTYLATRWTEEEITVELTGEKLPGLVRLRRLNISTGQWLFTWRPEDLGTASP
jgi:hypothetical protein